MNINFKLMKTINFKTLAATIFASVAFGLGILWIHNKFAPGGNGYNETMYEFNELKNR